LDGQSAKKEAGAREREERFVATKAGAIGKESEAKMRRREREDDGGGELETERGKRRGVVLESE
jgi:hypothetical protein